jgi:hypothetical protein
LFCVKIDSLVTKYVGLTACFEKLIWQKDRVLLDDLVFRLEPFPREEGWDEDYFRFYKDKIILDQYEAFWRSVEPFKVHNMLEFGIWDGGSLALWFECLRPAKLMLLSGAISARRFFATTNRLVYLERSEHYRNR